MNLRILALFDGHIPVETIILAYNKGIGNGLFSSEFSIKFVEFNGEESKFEIRSNLIRDIYHAGMVASIINIEHKP